VFPGDDLDIENSKDLDFAFGSALATPAGPDPQGLERNLMTTSPRAIEERPNCTPHRNSHVRRGLSLEGKICDCGCVDRADVRNAPKSGWSDARKYRDWNSSLG
jgi:hypothetical protein